MDNGVGVSEESLRRLFEPLAEIESQPTDGENSTGLGLALSKGVVESFNGSIFAESNAPKPGLTVCVELPHLPVTK